MLCAAHPVVSPEEHGQRRHHAHSEKQQEHPTQSRCSEGMHRGYGPAPIHEHAIQRQAECDVDEHDVPHAEHATPFLYHDGMDEGGEGNPRHESGVFHRVPEPESAPTQDGVGPPGSKEEPGGQQRPDSNAPGAPGVDPFIAAATANQAAQREGEGDADSHQPGHQGRRMEEHAEMG